MRVWILVSAALGLLTFGVLVGLRRYPLELGIMSAVGVSALTFATLQTIHRLREQYRRDAEALAALEDSASDAPSASEPAPEEPAKSQGEMP